MVLVRTGSRVAPRIGSWVGQTAVVAVLFVAVAASACSSGDGESADGGGTTSAQTGSISPNPQKLAAFIEIQTCDNAGGVATSTGTIENQGDESVAYHVEINFTDATGKVLATGSDETDTVAPGATGNWSVSATGLGDAELTCRTARITAADGAGKGAGGATTTTLIEGYPCNLLTAAEIEQLTGNPLDADASTSPISEGGNTWTAQACTWTGLGLPEPTEVILHVAKADGFESGTVGCPPLPGKTASVAGVGDQASWAYSDPGTSVKVGKLRVCTKDALVDVEVSGPGSEASLKQVATGVATKVLEAL